MRHFSWILVLPTALGACDAPTPAPPGRQAVTKATPPAPLPAEPIPSAPSQIDEASEPPRTPPPLPISRPVPTSAASTGRLPLARILAIAQAEVPGEVIEVDLDEDDGIEIYELSILTSAGRKIEMEIDARTGRILDVEED